MTHSADVDIQSVRNPQQAWKECLKLIKENVTLMTYNTWFLPIKPVSLDDNTLKIKLPSQFFWEWIDEHYNTLINKSIKEVLGEGAKLSYMIGEEKDSIDTENKSLPLPSPEIKIEQVNSRPVLKII